MARPPITTDDYRRFFAGFGLTKPIDLSTVEDAGWQLREETEALLPELLNIQSRGPGNSYIRFDELKKVEGASLPVFREMAGYDEEPDLSLYELALGLEKAGLFNLPLQENVTTLWQSFDSLRWGILKDGRQSELANYLDSHRTDVGRENALRILEERAEKAPSDFETVSSFDGRLISILLGTGDPDIRRRTLNLFQTSTEAGGEELLDGFANLEGDFRPLLEQLRVEDLAVVQQELLKSSNPRKVAFGLLCAKKLLNKTQFTAFCRRFFPGQSPIASKKVFHYGTKRSTAATLGELAKALVVQERHDPTRFAGIEF